MNLTAQQQTEFDDMVRRGVAENTDWKCIDWFLKYGTAYTPKALPADIQRMRVGRCFDNSIVTALFSDGKYRYVEGISRRSDIPDFWKLHAWVTDREGSVFDMTWGVAKDGVVIEVPPPFDYIGIVMDGEAVSKFMLKTGYAGVLANAHRAPKEARRAYTSLVPVPTFL